MERSAAFSFVSSNSICLDVVRVFAAQLVLWSHMRGFFFPNFDSLQHPSLLVKAFYAMTALGHSGVMVFFVLSGYLVGSSTLRDINRGAWSWKKYLLNRLTRLLIVLLPALSVGFMWDSIGLRLFSSDAAYLGNFRALVRYPVADALNWKVLLGNICFLQTFRIPGMGQPRLLTFGSNVVLWSLAFEFWYYLLFPMICLVFHKSSTLLKRCVYLLLIVGIMWAIGAWIWEGFIIWLLGAALFFAPGITFLKGISLKIAVGIASVLVVAMLLFDTFGSGPHRDFVLGVSCVLLIYLIAQLKQPFGGFSVFAKVPHYFAASSYTLYLSHFPLLVFLQAALLRGVRWQPTYTNLGILVCIGAAAILYSFALYFCFESRTDKLRAAIAPAVMAKAKAAQI